MPAVSSQGRCTWVAISGPEPRPALGAAQPSRLLSRTAPRPTARFALFRGYHTIVEGIFAADHYGQMLAALISDHAGSAFAYLLDVPSDETLRRHATKPGVLKYGDAEMRRWYRGLDLLPGGIEQVIPAESALENTVSRLMADAGLDWGL